MQSSKEEILKKLPFIFPVGTPCRNECISKIAASAIHIMISSGAIEGMSVCVNPRHILRKNRAEPYKVLQRKRPLYVTLCHGLIPAGAVKVLPGVYPNPYKPKYYLEKEFALLFCEGLGDKRSSNKNIRTWQKKQFDEETYTTILRIHEATQKLPEHQKKLFVMTRYENHSRKKAAEKLGLSMNALNYDLERALKFIRKHTEVQKL